MTTECECCEDEGVWDPKDPGDKLDYTFGWDRVIGAPNDAVIDHEWDEFPAGLTVVEIPFVPGSDITGLTIDGGEAQQSYKFTCRVVTALGRKYERTRELFVMQK